ncbi:MAG: aldehyde oxidase, partial [Desulfomonilaceae bacterium]
MRTIGRNIPRIGAQERALGVARFASDYASKEMLTLMVLRSDRHHALIKKIDVRHAYEIPGCVRVFTHEDIPGVNRFGIITKDQRLLAEEKVRCIGDPVCLVAAENQEAAEKALKAIKVTYEDLPPVFDP